MKLKFAFTAALTLGLIAALVLATRHVRDSAHQPLPPGARSFQVLGQVRGLDLAAKTVRIAHEEIPGYMPAMTMPLTVKDQALLKGLAVGDEVQFQLQVTADDSWISHIEKIATTASADNAEVRPARAVEEFEVHSLQSGEAVPDFQMTDQDGRPMHLKDFRGQAVVLTFIYTRCPLPNFCPLMSKNFAELSHRLSQEFPNKYHLLSISMDPEFDRPEVLKEYASRYGASSKDWTFGVTEPEALNFAAGLVGLYFAKESGLISHDLRTALIGPDGRLVHVWKSNVWTPYEIQRSVREVLTGHSDVASR